MGKLISAYVLLLFSALPAAVIEGTVTDELTTAPVESALVKVKGTATQTYTDAAGHFSLETSTGVGDLPAAVPGSAGQGEVLRVALVTLYCADGSLVRHGRIDLLADGVYFVTFASGDRSYMVKLIKTAGRCRFGQGCEARAKAGATVTLVYTHKYYTTTEASASEGDRNVTARLTMWWPDETNTGVLPGTNLTPYTGGGPGNGAIIENKDINRALDFSASNVTIRNCRIHTGDYWAIYLRSGTNLLVENCELYSTVGQGELCGIRGGNMTVRKCNIYNWENGIEVGSNTLIEDCYIHQPSTRAGAHNDGIQWSGASNVVIRHNHIDINDETGCVNVGGGGSSGLWNIAIYYNLLNGGTYSIYLEGRASHTPGGIHGVRIIGNVWEAGSYTYGTHTIEGDVTDVTWLYNCLDDGTAVNR